MRWTLVVFLGFVSICVVGSSVIPRAMEVEMEEMKKMRYGNHKFNGLAMAATRNGFLDAPVRGVMTSAQGQIEFIGYLALLFLLVNTVFFLFSSIFNDMSQAGAFSLQRNAEGADDNPQEQQVKSAINTKNLFRVIDAFKQASSAMEQTNTPQLFGAIPTRSPVITPMTITLRPSSIMPPRTTRPPLPTIRTTTAAPTTTTTAAESRVNLNRVSAPTTTIEVTNPTPVAPTELSEQLKAEQSTNEVLKRLLLKKSYLSSLQGEEKSRLIAALEQQKRKLMGYTSTTTTESSSSTTTSSKRSNDGDNTTDRTTDSNLPFLNSFSAFGELKPMGQPYNTLTPGQRTQFWTFTESPENSKEEERNANFDAVLYNVNRYNWIRQPEAEALPAPNEYFSRQKRDISPEPSNSAPWSLYSGPEPSYSAPGPAYSAPSRTKREIPIFGIISVLMLIINGLFLFKHSFKKTMLDDVAMNSTVTKVPPTSAGIKLLEMFEDVAFDIATEVMGSPPYTLPLGAKMNTTSSPNDITSKETSTMDDSLITTVSSETTLSAPKPLIMAQNLTVNLQTLKDAVTTPDDVGNLVENDRTKTPTKSTAMVYMTPYTKIKTAKLTPMTTSFTTTMKESTPTPSSSTAHWSRTSYSTASVKTPRPTTTTTTATPRTTTMRPTTISPRQVSNMLTSTGRIFASRPPPFQFQDGLRPSSNVHSSEVFKSLNNTDSKPWVVFSAIKASKTRQPPATVKPKLPRISSSSIKFNSISDSVYSLADLPPSSTTQKTTTTSTTEKVAIVHPVSYEDMSSSENTSMKEEEDMTNEVVYRVWSSEKKDKMKVMTRLNEILAAKKSAKRTVEGVDGKRKELWELLG